MPHHLCPGIQSIQLGAIHRHILLPPLASHPLRQPLQAGRLNSHQKFQDPEREMGDPEGRGGFPSRARQKSADCCMHHPPFWGAEKRKKLPASTCLPSIVLFDLFVLLGTEVAFGEAGGPTRQLALFSSTHGKLLLSFVLTSPPLFHPTASLPEVATNLGSRNARNAGNPDGADEERKLVEQV